MRLPPVARFIGRRALLAVPTLFGVAVVTFALVHLAPGDPAEAQGGHGRTPLSKRDIEAQRRIYFLDLPLFWNGDPRGVEALEQKLLAALGQGAKGGGDQREQLLKQCGTLCLPALARAQKAGKAGAAKAIDAIRAAHESLGPPAPATRAKWLAAVLPLLAPQALAKLTARAAAASGSDEAPFKQLTARGKAALPGLMEIVLDTNASRALRKHACAAASDVADFDGRLDQGNKDHEVFTAWRAFWYRERRDHVRFSGSERFFGHVTQTQFGRWIGRLLSLQLGVSLRDGRPVTRKIAEALPVTLLLGGLALLLAFALGIPLGVWSARRRGRPLERAASVTMFTLFSLPSFWVAMMLILLFGGVGYLDWFPIYGLASAQHENASGMTWLFDRLHHIVLPVLCLTYLPATLVAQHQREAMLGVLGQDYMRTARAKGLSERAVLWRHGLPNGLLPTITLLGLYVPYVIGGSVIVERIFNLPGMGLLAFEAFQSRDYPVIMAVTLFSALVTIAGLLLSDVLYGVVDPRIRVGAVLDARDSGAAGGAS
ncbi:MAG: ABC transporter permease [Myxococcales bacterium]|nr:ABC transporter permease [Myxococcales bacterium]